MGFLRRHKLLSAAMLAVLLVVIGVTTLVIRFVASFSPVPLVISKETTYITEPLRSDGTPDYVAAINQRLSAGVTPENNSAVLFWKAAGPSMIRESRRRDAYFQMLGVPIPPEKGDYFITSEVWTDRCMSAAQNAATPANNESSDPFEVLLKPMSRPWSRHEFPESAAWLDANEKALRLVTEGCKRPRRYDPLTLANENDALISAILPDAQQCRDFGHCLALRAMLRVKEGNVDEAWSDLLACHRLARLVGQGATLVEASVAVAIDYMAQTGDCVLLQHVRLTPSQIAKMQGDLAELPPMPGVAELMDRGERFTMLDSALWMKRQVEAGCRTGIEKAGLTLTAGLDWNIILRIVTSWHDRLVAAVRKPTRLERQTAIEEVERELKKEAAEAISWKAAVPSIVNRREVASRRVGTIIAGLMMPGEGVASTVEDSGAMQFALTKLAFALAQYHAKHSRYPAKLATLVPRHVKEVPKDIFNNNAELHYKREGDGYLLYSVGPNGKDDGGRGSADCKKNDNWDDLAVRMPASASP